MSNANDRVYEVLLNLKKIQQETKNRVHNHYKDMELTAPQGMLCMMINRHGSLKISEISEKIGLSNSTVSGIVDRLELQGLVERKRSTTDRRVVNVTGTKQLSEGLKFHDNLIDAIMKEALSIATEDELDTIATGLEILSRLLHKEE